MKTENERKVLSSQNWRHNSYAIKTVIFSQENLSDPTHTPLTVSENTILRCVGMPVSKFTNRERERWIWVAT